MLRKFLVISFAISLFIIIADTETSAQTRVTFKKGEISGKVSGTLKPNESRNFVLSAYEGQEIRVNVYSKNDRVKVEGEGGPTSNVFDAVDGNNVIRIYNSSKYLSKFSAVFSVNSLVNNVPREITFKKGSSSAKIDSTVAGNGERKFLLRAKKGQEIRVKILSMNDAIMVEGEGGLTENIFDAVDGDNIIRIYNNTNRRAGFMATFTITDLKNRVENSNSARVNFDKGKSSKTIKSTIGGNLSRVFVLNASKGQIISAKITSKNKGVMINEEEGATSLQMEAKAGDNEFEIINKSNASSAYTLTFSVTNKKLPPPTRISFDKGATSKTIDMVMNKYQMERTFVIGVGKGQFVDIQIMSSEAAKRVGTRVIEESSVKLLNWVDDVGYLTLEADANGDVVFEVSKNDENYLSSKMKVTIKDDPRFTTTRIKFDKGKSSKTIDLSIGANEKSRKFVVGAMKGQTINIDIETKDAVERISMNLDNAVDNEDDWLDGFGYLMVTTGRTGDYIFEVIKLDKKYLSAKMKISIKSNK